MVSIKDSWPKEGEMVTAETTGGETVKAHRYGFMWYVNGILYTLDNKEDIEQLISCWETAEPVRAGDF